MINSCADLLVLLRSMEEPGKEQRKKNVKLLEKQVKQRPETTEWLVQILEDESKWADNQYCAMYDRIFVQLVESPHLDLALAKRIYRFMGLYQNENNRMNRDTSRCFYKVVQWIDRSEFCAELERMVPDVQKEVKERQHIEEEKKRLDNEEQERRYQNRLREEMDNEDSNKTVGKSKKKPKGSNNKPVVNLLKQHTNNQNGSQNQNGSSSTITPKTSPLCPNRHCESIRGINDVLGEKIAKLEKDREEDRKEMREMKKEMREMESRICNLERQAGPTLARNLIDSLKEEARKLDEKEKKIDRRRRRS